MGVKSPFGAHCRQLCAHRVSREIYIFRRLFFPGGSGEELRRPLMTRLPPFDSAGVFLAILKKDRIKTRSGHRENWAGTSPMAFRKETSMGNPQWKSVFNNRICMFFWVTRRKEVILDCVSSISAFVDDWNSWNTRRAIEKRDWHRIGSAIFLHVWAWFFTLYGRYRMFE